MALNLPHPDELRMSDEYLRSDQSRMKAEGRGGNGNVIPRAPAIANHASRRKDSVLISSRAGSFAIITILLCEVVGR